MLDFQPINDLLNKKMDRQTFLKHLGASLVAMVGIGALIRNIAHPLKEHKKPVKPEPKATNSYGGGRPYGV